MREHKKICSTNFKCVCKVENVKLKIFVISSPMSLSANEYITF